MSDDLQIDELAKPNLNAVHLSGDVGTVERVGQRQQGLKFTVRYDKTWPDGHVTTEELPCYVSGKVAEGVQDWLKPGVVVVVQGELSAKAYVYARRLERLGVN